MFQKCLPYILCGNFIIATLGMDYYVKREHSLVQPFQGAGVHLQYWDFGGSTMVTNNYVRLTPDIQSKSGVIWNKTPCRTKNWEVEVVFHIHGKHKELFGDGFAIWYTRDKMEEGPVFGSKNNFCGLAVIVDTYSNGVHNHQHPYLSAMVNNGSWSYDHKIDGSHTQLAGCEVRFRNVEYHTYLRIRYANNRLSVTTNLENKDEWKSCLIVDDVHLPTGYYFGMSAETGDLSDNHDILGFRFHDLDSSISDEEIMERMTIIPSAKTFEPPREPVPDVKPGISNLKIFLVLLFGMLAAFAITLFIISYTRERNSRKRFY